MLGVREGFQKEVGEKRQFLFEKKRKYMIARSRILIASSVISENTEG